MAMSKDGCAQQITCVTRAGDASVFPEHGDNGKLEGMACADKDFRKACQDGAYILITI